jgi:hypothetical protein
MIGGNQSDVARVLTQIGNEYESAQNALYGFANGTARHEFITARMENMGHLHTQLQGLVGDDQAMALIADQLDGR